MTLQADGFEGGRKVPPQYTCDGVNRPPEVHWNGAPAKTRSFAITLDDPDAPSGTWTHWMLWNIPAGTSSLSEACRPESPVQTGINDFGRHGYGGPCPPRGHGPHRYFFRIHALDVETLPLGPEAKRKDFDQAIHGHVLETGYCYGVFERRK